MLKEEFITHTLHTPHVMKQIIRVRALTPLFRKLLPLKWIQNPVVAGGSPALVVVAGGSPASKSRRAACKYGFASPSYSATTWPSQHSSQRLVEFSRCLEGDVGLIDQGEVDRLGELLRDGRSAIDEGAV